MNNDKLSEDIEDSLEVDDKPEEVRKYGKKKKNKKFRYFLFFILFLLFSFCALIALNKYFTDYQMKKDLSTKEKGIDKSKLLKIIEIIVKILEFLKDIMNRIMLDRIDDEHIKQCIQLNEMIKTLYDNINKTLKGRKKERVKIISKEELLEKIKRTNDLIGCIIDYWETNGFEKCFEPGSGTEAYFYYFRLNVIESGGYTNPKTNLDSSLIYEEPPRYSSNVPSTNSRFNPSIENDFCPGMGLMGSHMGSFMI